MSDLDLLHSHAAGCPFCSRVLAQESFEAEDLCEAGEAYYLAFITVLGQEHVR